MIKGSLKSATALKLIKEWALLRNKELNENWNNILNKTEVNRIAPLE